MCGEQAHSRTAGQRLHEPATRPQDSHTGHRGLSLAGKHINSVNERLFLIKLEEKRSLLQGTDTFLNYRTEKGKFSVYY